MSQTERELLRILAYARRMLDERDLARLSGTNWPPVGHADIDPNKVLRVNLARQADELERLLTAALEPA